MCVLCTYILVLCMCGRSYFLILIIIAAGGSLDNYHNVIRDEIMKRAGPPQIIATRVRVRTEEEGYLLVLSRDLTYVESKSVKLLNSPIMVVRMRVTYAKVNWNIERQATVISYILCFFF